MVEWKRNIAQVITLIVGTGLVASGFNSFYNDFYNKPRIDIQIVPLSQSSEQTVVLTNEGRIPATNFFLTLVTPQDMVDYPNYPQNFSTLNETKVMRINSTLLQVGVPMFPHGDGSFARINLRYNVSESSTIYPKYTAYITYNQGSSKIFIERPLTPVDVISNFWNTYWISMVTIAVGIYILLSILIHRRIQGYEWLLPGGQVSYAILPFLWLVGPARFTARRPRERVLRYKTADQILDDILEIQRMHDADYGTVKYSDPWDRTEEETRRRIFNHNMKAYNLIANLFSILSDYYYANERLPWSSEAQKQKDREELDNLGAKIRDKCNEVINDIDWKGFTYTK